MQFNTHEVEGPIQPFIESIFHLEDFIPDHSKERVIPTGHVFLIFELDGFTRHVYDNLTLETIQTHTHVWLSGMHSDYITISAHPHSEMIVIQFRPYGCYPFIDAPLSTLNDQVIQASQIFGDSILDLQTKLSTLKDAPSKLGLVSSWLSDKFDNHRIPPPELIQIVHDIQQSSELNLSSITDSYPYTTKHLIDQFKRYVGLTPKSFHRIFRFNEILQQIKSNTSLSWSDIAYTCGYADQSHFIKEFKRFSGFIPSEFIHLEHQSQVNFFPLDRKG